MVRGDQFKDVDKKISKIIVVCVYGGIVFPIIGNSNEMVLLIRLLIVKSLLVDQLHVSYMVFLKSTKLVALSSNCLLSKRIQL